MTTQAEQFMVEWLDWCVQVRGLSLASRKIYARTLKQLLNWCEKKGVDPLIITGEEMEAFAVRSLSNGRARSSATRQLDRSVLSGWYDWLARRRITSIADPTLWLPKSRTSQPAPKPVHLDDWLYLWYKDLTPRWRFMLGSLYFLGLRSTELVNLQTAQLKPALIYNLHGKGGKVVNFNWRLCVDILIAFNPTVRADLFIPAYEQCMNSPLTRACTYGSRQTLREGMQALALNAGIANGAITPRRCRSSAATNLLDTGMPADLVRVFTRHTNKKDTLEHYADQTAAHVRAWFEREKFFRAQTQPQQ